MKERDGRDGHIMASCVVIKDQRIGGGNENKTVGAPDARVFSADV